MKKHPVKFALGLGAVLVLMLCTVLAGLHGQQAWMFQQGDGKPFYVPDVGQRFVTGLWGAWNDTGLGVGRGGRALQHSRLLALFMPPLIYHVARYVLDVLLMGLGAYWFLIGRRVRPRAALLAGVFLALSGYFFSLIYAGHARIVDLMPLTVLAFGCVDRALDRKSFLHWGWAGLCMGFALAQQADVAGIMGLMLLCYGGFRYVALVRENRDGRLRRTVQTVFGGLLALAACAIIAFPSIGDLSRTLATRESHKAAGETSQWEYATSWSMPPEEILELVAPCVFGIATGNRSGPYWGRVGRSMGWPDKPGLQNLKQHTVYLGAIPLLFGAYAIAYRLRRRRGGPADSDDDPEPYAAARSDALFWGVAFVLAVMLAMGRYFPLYRVFYSLPLPFTSKIRCPIKFMHLAEVALAFLFGMGVDALLAELEAASQGRRKRVFAARTFVAVGVGLAALLVGGTAIASAFSPGLRSYWSQLQLAPFADTMMSLLKSALLRGAFLATVAAGAFVLAWLAPKRTWAALAAWCLLLAAVAINSTGVARRYIPLGDLRPWYGPNPIAERILNATAHTMGRTEYLISAPAWAAWPYGSLRTHGVDLLRRPQTSRRLPEDYQKFVTALQSNPVRLWQLTNTRFVLGEAKQLQALLASPAFDVVARFDLDGGRYRERTSPQGRFVLVRNNTALPRAQVYYAWDAVPRPTALERLASPQWAPAEMLLVSGDDDANRRESDMAPTTANIIDYGPTRVEIEVNARRDGVLVLRDRYDPDWRVRVNDKTADLVIADYLMRGVRLPPGKHTVEMTYRPYLVPFLLSVGTCLALLVWTGGAWVANRRRATSP